MEETVEDSNVLVEQSGASLTITLNRPQAINALSYGMLQAIDAALEGAEKNDEVRTVILRGAGERGFCAGMDNKDASVDLDTREAAIHNLTRRIAAFPKPVISLIFGHVIAGGARIALAADIIVAGESLRLREGHVLPSQHFPVPGGSPIQDDGYVIRLSRQAGRVSAKLFAIADELFTAQQALSLGLVSMVVPDADLGATGDRLAAGIAKYPPKAVSYTLALIDGAADEQAAGA